MWVYKSCRAHLPTPTGSNKKQIIFRVKICVCMYVKCWHHPANANFCNHCIFKLWFLVNSGLDALPRCLESNISSPYACLFYFYDIINTCFSKEYTNDVEFLNHSKAHKYEFSISING